MNLEPKTPKKKYFNLYVLKKRKINTFLLIEFNKNKKFFKIEICEYL
jgi:hypothetical protein